MKKLIVIFVLVAVLTSAIYAQELKFDGYVNTGLGVVATGDDDVDMFLKPFGADAEQNGYRFRLNGSYANEDKNAGVRFRFQSQSRLDQAGYFSIPYAYGWVNFMDNVFYLAGGIVDDGTWVTADWWINDDVGKGLGMLLKVTPVQGLDLGVGAYTISQQSGGNNNILNFQGDLPNFASITPKIKDAKYTLNGAFAVPDLLRVGASFRLKNKAGWDRSLAPTDDDTDYVYDGRHESSLLMADVRLFAISGLTAVVAVSLDKLEEFSDTGNIVLSETFGYKLGDISLGLNAVQFLYNREDAYNPGLLFNLWGSMPFGKIVPRADLVYFMGGSSTVATGAYTWHRKGFANRAAAKDADQDYSVFSARPSVKFNLDNRTFIEVGDVINYDFASFEAFGGEKSRLSNVFYVDLKWSF